MGTAHPRAGNATSLLLGAVLIGAGACLLLVIFSPGGAPLMSPGEHQAETTAGAAAALFLPFAVVIPALVLSALRARGPLAPQARVAGEAPSSPSRPPGLACVDRATRSRKDRFSSCFSGLSANARLLV